MSFERVENKVAVNREPSSLPGFLVDRHAEVAADYCRVIRFHLIIIKARTNVSFHDNTMQYNTCTLRVTSASIVCIVTARSQLHNVLFWRCL